MARINIEDKWWTDPRRQLLARALGSEALATGVFFCAVRLAQEYWRKGQSLIPFKIWEHVEHHVSLIEYGLAERRETGVYLSGSEEWFEWIDLRRDAARKGGAKRSEQAERGPDGRFKRGSEETETVQPNSSQTPAGATQNHASFSFSISNSNTKNTKGAQISKTDLTSEAPPGGQASADADSCDPFADLKMPEVRQQQALEKPSTRGGRSPDQRARIAKFVAAYVSAYEGKFGHRPEDLSDPKVRGQITAWAKDHPDIDRACELVQVFFQLDRKWFQVKGYDFLTFRNNLNAVGQALAQGSDSLSGGYSEAEIKRMTQGWGEV